MGEEEALRQRENCTVRTLTAFPFASLYFLKYLFFSFTNWQYKNSLLHLAEGIWLSQKYPASSQSILGGARDRDAGARRRLGRGERFLATWGSFSLPLSLSALSRHWTQLQGEESPHLPDWGCATGASQGGVSIYRSLRSFWAGRSSLVHLQHPCRPSFRNHGTPARGSRIINPWHPASSLLPTRGLPTLKSCDLSAAEPRSSAVRTPVVTWQSAHPAFPVCSWGTESASSLLLQTQAPLVSSTSWSVHSRPSWAPFAFQAPSMSGSGRKDFDVKHILRLRWKLFSHPSPSPGSPAGGGCLQQDGNSSFEHWGPSQSRLLKNQEKGSVSTFWKKPSSSSSSSSSSPSSLSSSFNPLNGTLLPVATRLQQGAPGQGTQQPTRTLFYVESLEEEEVPGLDFPGPHEKGLVLEELKVEPTCSSQATGEGCGHRYSKSPRSIQASPTFYSFSRPPYALLVSKSERFQIDNFG